MPRILVKNAQVNERNLPGKNGNGPSIIRSQMAALDLGNGYELPFRVGLGQRPAYPAGVYDIDPASFQLSDFGDLRLGRYVDLIPIEHKPAPAPGKA